MNDVHATVAAAAAEAPAASVMTAVPRAEQPHQHFAPRGGSSFSSSLSAGSDEEGDVGEQGEVGSSNSSRRSSNGNASKDEEEEDDNKEGEEGNPTREGRGGMPPFVYPSLLPHAPSLSSAHQDWLIGLFRDDTLRSSNTNMDYFSAIQSFWQKFERVLPPSLFPSFPLSTPQALREWLLKTSHVQTILFGLRYGKRQAGGEGVLSSIGRGALYVTLAGLGLRVTQDSGGRWLVPQPWELQEARTKDGGQVGENWKGKAKKEVSAVGRGEHERKEGKDHGNAVSRSSEKQGKEDGNDTTVMTSLIEEEEEDNYSTAECREGHPPFVYPLFSSMPPPLHPPFKAGSSAFS